MLGLFIDQIPGFGRVLGQVIEFPLFGSLPYDFHVAYAEGRPMALSPVKPFVRILLVFSCEVGKQIIGFNVFAFGFWGTGCRMNGCKNIRTQDRPVKSFIKDRLGKSFKKDNTLNKKLNCLGWLPQVRLSKTSAAHCGNVQSTSTASRGF